MRHEKCPYCAQQFRNEAGYERHLKADFGCMSPDEMYATEGFKRTSKGWTHNAPVVRRKRAPKRPPSIPMFSE